MTKEEIEELSLEDALDRVDKTLEELEHLFERKTK